MGAPMLPGSCFDCKHFVGIETPADGDELVVCDAFPKGIPDEIMSGENNHRKPFGGDNGIQYERGQRDNARAKD